MRFDVSESLFRPLVWRIAVLIHIMSSSTCILVPSQILLVRNREMKLAAKINTKLRFVQSFVKICIIIIITTILNRIIRTINYGWKLYNTYYECKMFVSLNIMFYRRTVYCYEFFSLVYKHTRGAHIQ